MPLFRPAACCMWRARPLAIGNAVSRRTSTPNTAATCKRALHEVVGRQDAVVTLLTGLGLHGVQAQECRIVCNPRAYTRGLQAQACLCPPSRKLACSCYHVYLHSGSGVPACCPEVCHRLQASCMHSKSRLEGSHDPGLGHWPRSRPAPACQCCL